MDKKNCPTCVKRLTGPGDLGLTCRWCEPTAVKWSPRRSIQCFAFRCHLPEARRYPGPAFVASGNARIATVGDTLTGAIIPDADYIAVRSCFCGVRTCAFYKANE